MNTRKYNSAFTLIELSIVLVIIGLIVGGVLVGQDLIRAAEVRAQITQIEKFNSAVNAFHAKYDAIPGDMALANASQFGFIVGTNCAGTEAERDGNGQVEGEAATGYKLLQTINETGLFWQDLATRGVTSMIEGQFPANGASAVGCATTDEKTLTATEKSEYFPVAKIGKGNYVYVYALNGINWYGLSAIQSVNFAFSGLMVSNATIPVVQSYNMDKKVDDGLPTTGKVQALYINNKGLA